MASTLLRAAAHYDRRAATARTLQSIQSVRGALVNAWSLAPFKSRNTAANRIAFILRSVNITKLAHAANASTAVRALRQGQFGQRASGLRTAVVTGWRAYNRSGLGPRHMLSPAAVAARVRGYWAWSMRHAETVLDRATAETDRIEPIEEDGAEEDGTSSDARIALGTLVPFAVSLMDIDASKWQLLSEKSGIKVFRCLAPQLPSGASSRWPCYRACSIIAGTPSDVAQLLFDSSKVHLINR